MNILKNLLFCCLLGLGRRLWGGLWSEILKKLHLPKISRFVIVFFYIPYIAIYLGNTYLTWFIGVWVCVMFALSMNYWWGIGEAEPREDQELDKYVLKKIYKKEMWYGASYDYTGLILHFTIISIPLLFYNTRACYNGILIPLGYAIFMPYRKNEIAELIFGFSIGLFLCQQLI